MWTDRSEQIDALAAAWVKASGEMEDITKGRKANVGQYAYTYADLADALSMARPILAKHDLMVTQSVATEGDDVLAHTTVLHTSGQFVTSQPVRLPAGKTPQQAGSAATYGRRYSLMAMLGLATEDDDGASAASRPAEAPRRPVEARKPAGKAQTPKPAEARTEAEQEIRAMIATLTTTEKEDLRADFRETFGSTLADLHPDMHGAAREYVADWVKGDRS